MIKNVIAIIVSVILFTNLSGCSVTDLIKPCEVFILGTELLYDGNTYTVNTTLQNSGNIPLEVVVVLSVTSIDGSIYLYKHTATLPPNTVVAVSSPLDVVPSRSSVYSIAYGLK
jgi:hypothetical protein